MCKRNGHPERASRFICMSCMKENMLAQGIQRMKRREKFHIKDLYCLNCRKVCKCCEIRYCDSYNEVYEKAIKIRNKYVERIDKYGTE